MEREHSYELGATCWCGETNGTSSDLVIPHSGAVPSARPAEQGTAHIAQQIRDGADMGKIYKRMEEAAGSQFGRVQLSQYEIGVVLRTLHDYRTAENTPEQLAQRIYDAAEKVVITEEPLHFVRKVPTPNQIAEIIRESRAAAVSVPEPDEREAFEKWVTDKGYSVRKEITIHATIYWNPSTQQLWEAWQAAWQSSRKGEPDFIVWRESK